MEKEDIIKEEDMKTWYDSIREIPGMPEQNVYLQLMEDVAMFHRTLSRYVDERTAQFMQEPVWDVQACGEFSLYNRKDIKKKYDSVVLELRRLCQNPETRGIYAPILQDLDQGWLALEKRVERLPKSRVA